MLRQSFLTLALLLLPMTPVIVPNYRPAIAADNLPRANALGDYATRTSHRAWLVVDPDPKGLNCRWSSAMPADWADPRVAPLLNSIDQWDVVRRFRKNTVVTANTAPAGFAQIFDGRNKPWLKINIDGKNRICLIRANSKYVQPVTLATDP